MNEIEQQILGYHDLSPDEQEGVEEYVAAHPEWQPLLRDVKALEALASEARLLHSADIHDEVLAYYVVYEYLGERRVSARMSELFDQIDARLDTDAALNTRYEAFKQRLDRALNATDPTEQFERLSGHDLDTMSPSEPQSESQTEPQQPVTASPQSSWLDWLAMMPRAFQWALAAVCIAALVYGVLWMASGLSQSDIEELAVISPSETQVEGYTVRLRSGNAQATSSADALYRQALAALRDARTSFFGLFPGYDTAALTRADSLLTQVVDREEAGSFLQLEAHYFLGKIRLAQREVEAARAHFKTVVEGGGSKAPESADILNELQRIAPSQKGAESYFGPDQRLPTGSDAPDA